MYKDREKPRRWLRPKNCLEGQRIPQLKSEICSTIFTKSIGSFIDIENFIDIEKPIDINNISGNKEVDHLF